MPKPDGFLRKLLELEELHSAPSAVASPLGYRAVGSAPICFFPSSNSCFCNSVAALCRAHV